MRTIAIINQKGGCGKTTTSINLAACLARLSQKTLLVDMDPQGHCAVGLAVPEEQIERTVLDALIEPRDGKPVPLADTVWQIASDFDLSPANIKLAAFEQIFAGRDGREDRLKNAIAPVINNYKWCIIDCPPSVGLITFNALRACDEVIVPVETGYFSLHGLAKMMQTLEVLREKCGKDILIRVLPTLYDTRTKLAREVLSELRNKFKEYLMESTVNFNTKLKEAASFGQPITEYDPGSRGYKDFLNLARELMGHRPVDEEGANDTLSRPAELVQRAKQLAQLTNLQFGKNTVTTPGAATHSPAHSPLLPLTPTPAPGLNPSPVLSPGPALSPISAATLASAPMVAGTPMMGGAMVNLGPAASSALSEPAEATPMYMGAASGAGAALAAPPMPSLGLSMTANFAKSSMVLDAPSRQMASVEEDQADSAVRRRPISFMVTEAPVARETQPVAAPVAASPKSIDQKLAEFYGVKQVGGEVIFAARFDAAKKVLIAGDFNNWSPMSTPMINRGRPGEFWMCLPLRPGRYRYRFVVDGKWMTDPHNSYVEANQFGELNNVIEVD